MFTIQKGDLFSVESGYIMHGCNAQGVMGSGVARIIRNKYPEAYERYAAQRPYYILGEVIPVKVADDLTIINAITQNLYGTDKRHADYDAIRQAMKGAIHLINTNQFSTTRELHMPFIGAGLAGGDPAAILEIMHYELSGQDFDSTLWIYDDMLIENISLVPSYKDNVVYLKDYKDL